MVTVANSLGEEEEASQTEEDHMAVMVQAVERGITVTMDRIMVTVDRMVTLTTSLSRRSRKLAHHITLVQTVTVHVGRSTYVPRSLDLVICAGGSMGCLSTHELGDSKM